MEENKPIAGWPFASLIENVYLPHFHKEGEKAIKHFLNSSIATRSFMSAYKQILPIEEMSEKDKLELKRFVNELIPDKTTEEKLIACKLIHALGTLLA